MYHKLKKIGGALSDTSIFIKIIVVILVISIIPVFALTIFYFRQSTTYINNELTQSYRQIYNQYMANLNYRIERHHDTVSQLTQNNSIQDALANSSAEQNSIARGLTVTKEISRYMGIDKNYGLDNCMIYSYLEENPIYHSKVSMIDIGKTEDWYSAYLNRDGNSFLYKKKDNSTIMSFVDTIIGINFYKPYYGEVLGIIKLDINTNVLFSPLEDMNNQVPYDIVIFSADNSVIYTTDTGYAETIRERYPSELLCLDQPVSIDYNKSSYILFSGSMNECSLKIILGFPTDLLSVRIKNTLLTISVVIAISLVLTLCFAIIFSKNFSNRIHFILNKMKQVEHGDLTITSGTLEGTDEIAVIDQHFNQMVAKLEESINKNYIAMLEKKEAELHALQLQINPHFLYNTLETISSLAMENKVYIISDISERLGELFRYATNKESHDYASVEQEVKNTKNYIYIQQIRFPNQFEVFYNIEPSLQSCLIPRFILQPIVENAILHGLKDTTKPGYLEISVYEDNSMLIITVDDDGVGMNQEQLNDLNQYINNNVDNVVEGHKSSIGIKNVNMRIQFCYGKDYGISIFSKPLQGTNVQIKLPLYGKS